LTRILVAHESESIREVIRRLLEGVGWQVESVADGTQAVRALEHAPSALVLDVAVGGKLAYEVVEEARKHAATRVVLIASIYNRTGYKRRPTSLYGADDYVEQHHIPDALVGKLSKLIGDPPTPVHLPPPHVETPESRAIRAAGEGRLDPPKPARDPVQRAERLARLIVADIALYNGDAIDRAARGGSHDELEARLRMDLEEGRLLFDLRVPAEVRRIRDFIGEALEQLKTQRAHEGNS
jgi:CheY-like chemotaxis protein